VNSLLSELEDLAPAIPSAAALPPILYAVIKRKQIQCSKTEYELIQSTRAKLSTFEKLLIIFKAYDEYLAVNDFEPELEILIQKFTKYLNLEDKNEIKNSMKSEKTKRLFEGEVIGLNTFTVESEFLISCVLVCIFEEIAEKSGLVLNLNFKSSFLNFINIVAKDALGNEMPTIQNLNTQKKLGESKIYEKILKEILKYTK